MRKILAICLLLLLCGCAASVPQSPSHGTDNDKSAEHAFLPMEEQFGGALQVYSLPDADAVGMLAWGEDLLIFSGGEQTTLTLLRANGQQSQLALSFFLSPEDPSLRLQADGLSYFDPEARQIVVTDREFTPITQIAAPADMAGVPILSRDRSTLYYCTTTSIRAWDLNTGIRRQIRQMSNPCQTVTGLYWDEQVLSCQIRDEKGLTHLFVSTETGALLFSQPDPIVLYAEGGQFMACFPTGMTSVILSGSDPEQAIALTPRQLTAHCFLLPEDNAVVTGSITSSGSMLLEYYSMGSGLRSSQLLLGSDALPEAVVSIPQDGVYVLAQGILYRWDTAAEGLSVSDTQTYTGTYYSAKSPDLAGISRCQLRADHLGETYGIRIFLWKEATDKSPWDYRLTPEYLVPVLERNLDTLESCLAHFPPQILQETAAHFSSLEILLTRQISGTDPVESLETATGIQFFEDTDDGGRAARIALAAAPTLEKAFYHELFHVMETHIFAESIAFDQWDQLNPSGFSYDYDYTANAQRDSGVYLSSENRAFVDTYSMSYPKEDRARIFENAMVPGKASLFASPLLQSKLKTICDGIREAYHLEKSEEVFLWEQYLQP